MSNDRTIEQRGATRYNADGDVSLTSKSNNFVCRGRLKDVSDSGVFILLDEPPEASWVDENCEMRLHSLAADNPLEILGDVRVVRTTQKGVAVFIQNIHASSRMSFVKFMVFVRQRDS